MKLEELKKISNPDKVYKKFKKMGFKGTISVSTRKDKKYMVISPDGKKVHFGSTMEDYTYHNDKDRLNNFRNRNKKWKDYPIYSPAYLSYYLLW